MPVLTQMEMNGVLLDIPFLAKMSEQLGHRLAELEQELFKLVGHEFNLRSTQQLSQVLFDEMDFPAKGLKRTASGHYSTAVSTLEQLAASSDELDDRQVRVLEIIFEQRQLEKLRGTYVDAPPAPVNAETRLHTSFNQTCTSTDASARLPNRGTIPIRTRLAGRSAAFVAPPDWVLISADYSQAGCALAHAAGEGADRVLR